MAAAPGTVHSIGMPQWMGAASDSAGAAATGASPATSPPGKQISDIVSKHTYN